MTLGHFSKLRIVDIKWYSCLTFNSGIPSHFALQMIKVCGFLVIDFFIILSLTMRTPVKELFGDIVCWMVVFLDNLISTKYVLGGFFMALYRIICSYRPTQKYQRQRQITNQLFLIEWIIMLFLLGFYFIGSGITGTNSDIAFCRGLSLEMDRLIQRASGTSKWSMEVGDKFMFTSMFFAQLFIILELVSIHLFPFRKLKLITTNFKA